MVKYHYKCRECTSLGASCVIEKEKLKFTGFSKCRAAPISISLGELKSVMKVKYLRSVSSETVHMMTQYVTAESLTV